MTSKECKDRYFQKVYANAATILCACGCGKTLKNKDKYGRDRKFITGHNARKYYGEDASRWSAEKRWRNKNPDKVKNRKREYYRQRKLQAMSLKSNKCHTCNLEYNGTNAPVFEFHHTDPTTKESGITRLLTNKAWDVTLKELEQCILLCANCHNQFHGGQW